jgi:hypothetical protein
VGLSLARPDTAPYLAVVSRTISVGLLSAPVGFCVGWFLPPVSRVLPLAFVAALVVVAPFDLAGGWLGDGSTVDLFADTAVAVAATGVGLWCAREGYRRFAGAVRDLTGSR